jgi:hypothetical protein
MLPKSNNGSTLTQRDSHKVTKSQRGTKDYKMKDENQFCASLFLSVYVAFFYDSENLAARVSQLTAWTFFTNGILHLQDFRYI